jgi:hypothetical protein
MITRLRQIMIIIHILGRAPEGWLTSRQIKTGWYMATHKRGLGCSQPPLADLHERWLQPLAEAAIPKGRYIRPG